MTFTHPDPTVRRLALLNAADEAEPDSVPLLVKALREDPDARVRQTAAECLESWEEPEVVQALHQALLDESAEVRQSAAQTLSLLKNPQAALPLLPGLNHPNAFVRASVLRALRELRLQQSAEAAQALLGDNCPAVRREAISVLGWLRYSPAIPCIAQLAENDTDSEVRRIAVSALSYAGESALPSLIKALSDSHWQVRSEAAQTLGKLKIQHAATALEQCLTDDYWQVIQQAARSLGLLQHRPSRLLLESLLNHPISNLRRETALALGEIADPQSLLALQAAQTDPDPEVRKAVTIAIRQIDNAQAANNPLL